MEWRVIVDCSCYEVSENGDIRSWRPRGAQVRLEYERAPNCRDVKSQINRRTGYRMVTLVSDDGSEVTLTVHSVVCVAWHGPRPKGKVVRHRDNDKLNNNWRNLHWGTPLENKLDQLKHGTLPRGEKCYQAKLKVGDVYQIRQSTESDSILAERYGVSASHIGNVKAGRKWRHLLGGVPCLK